MGSKCYIGKDLKDYRKKRGLTQEDLAEIIDCSTSTVSRIENGEIQSCSRAYKTIINLLKDFHETDEELYIHSKEFKKLLYFMENVKGDDVIKKLDELKKEWEGNPGEHLLEWSNILWELICNYSYFKENLANCEKVNSIHERYKVFINKLFNPSDISQIEKFFSKRINYSETMTLNIYCILIHLTGENEKALSYLDMLIHNLEKFCLNEDKKHRELAGLYNNKAYIFLKSGALKKADEMLAIGWKYAKHMGSLHVIKSLFYNHACLSKVVGKKEDFNRDILAVDTMIGFSNPKKHKIFSNSKISKEDKLKDANRIIFIL